MISLYTYLTMTTFYFFSVFMLGVLHIHMTKNKPAGLDLLFLLVNLFFMMTSLWHLNH